MKSEVIRIKDESFKGISLNNFYDKVAEELNIVLKEGEVYDCRHIEVANNIQDEWFKYYKEQGMDNVSIGMILCIYGPKMNSELKDNEVLIENGFISKS